MRWKTWAPLRSKETKEICSHMPKAEQKKISQFGIINGIIVAIFFAKPLSSGLILSFKNKSYIGLVRIPLLVLIGVLILLFRRKHGKKLLCSTKGAQEQGYTHDKI